jgi:hypothetical protein
VERDLSRDLDRPAAVQQSMLDAAKACFTVSQLDDLRAVIRLTVEFHRTLEADGIDNYVCESVFSGLDSFTSVVYAYNVIGGAKTRSALQWSAVSISSLKQQFQSLYARFIAEESFEEQCRLLLDLFKLQLALAAMTYDCIED